MHAGPLQAAAWFTPMAAGGLIIATIGGFTLHLLPGRILLLTAGAGHLVAMLLFAIIPENGSYWAYVMPAMIGATVGIDIIYNVTTIFITTSLPRDRQGEAGALINCIIALGISFFLGLADLAVASNEHLGTRGSFKVAFWFGVGLSGASLVAFAFIKIGSAKSELTHEERANLETLGPGHVLSNGHNMVARHSASGQELSHDTGT